MQEISKNVSQDNNSKKRKELSPNQPTTELNKNEEISMKCIHHFGYLSETAKTAPIPEECFMCSKAVDCIIFPQD